MVHPNADSYYSQLCLICYLLCNARDRDKLLRCTIGRQVLKSKLFNDVFCELQRQEKCSLYLFDVKQHQYKNRRVSFNDLMGTSTSLDFDLLRYFKAYLQLRKTVDQPIRELVVWTRTGFNGKDLATRDMLRDYTSEENAVDLFDTDDFGIRRYRIGHYSAIEEALLRSCNPLFELATRLAHLMFSKSIISSKTVPKRFYDVLLRDVFEDSRFRADFLGASDALCNEAKQFHVLLEFVLGEQFQRRNVTDFHHLMQIEQKPFAAFVELRIVPCNLGSIKKDARWNVDYDVSRADVEQFFSLLVFYTNAPVKDKLGTIVQRYCDQVTLDVLKKVCQRGVLLQNAQVDGIFELISLKKSEELRTFEGFWFKYESFLDLGSVLRKFCSQNSCNTLVVESCGNLDISASRIVSVLKELSINYLCMTGGVFLEKKDKLLQIMHVLKPSIADRWILVVTTEDIVITDNLHGMDCSIIVVVPEVSSYQMANFPIHKDRFVFNDLDGIQDRLNSTSVLLQGRKVELWTLLSEDVLATISVPALVDWYRNWDQIVLGEAACVIGEEHFILRNLQTECNSIVDPFETYFDAVTILSGLPGIGKSTMLSRLAVDFREKFNDHFVILVDSKRIVDWFGSETDITAIVTKLMNMESADSFQKFVVQKIVEDRRIILLLDGFDEISQAKEGNALAMLQWIQTVDLRLVMIATRPHRLPFLKDHFGNPTVYLMQPFTEEDQLLFLQQRLPSMSANEFLILDLIRSFRTLFNDENSLDIPLQCTIIALIYEDHFEALPLSQWNAADVFQKFIDKKFEMYASKFFDLFNRAHEDVLDSLRTCFEIGHSELAFRLDTLQVIDHECFAKLEQYGLLQIDGETVSFIHSSFAEFFLTLYLVGHHVDQEHFNRYLSERFCKSTANRFNMFLEHHIHRADSRRKLEGSTTSFQNLNLKEFRTQRTHRLHADKIKQFHLFLMDSCSIEQQLEYVRTSVDHGEFGIFETIYESLPISLVQAVRFKFTTYTNDPLAVDLSTTSEGHLLLILTILQRQHPLDIVEKVIVSFTPEEDDFITMAITRNHQKIVQQLFTIEQSLNSENESDILLDYLGERWQQYLKLAVEYQRDDLLAQTLDSIGKRFHQRVIKYFLMNRNVQHVLMESCKSEEAAVEVVQRVIGFVEQNLSDYDLRALLNRQVDGVVFGERLSKLRNSQVKKVCEALWERYRIVH